MIAWAMATSVLVGVFTADPAKDSAKLRAGAVAFDITPTTFPVLVNGGMTSATATRVKTLLHARSLVLDDGNSRCAIVIVDSCMLPRPLLDEVKAEAARQTSIKPENMLIAATHTHSAAAGMGCLGTDADPVYVPFLKARLVAAIVGAEKRLEPAQLGWAVVAAPNHTALRQWVLRPDKMIADPFGNLTVRSNMHAGRILDDVTGESGPADPDLSMISVQARDGRPIALLANFSMHYFSDSPISADYFGLFCDGLRDRLAPGGSGNIPAFVGIMSHGCSGDLWRRDYRKPAPKAGEEPTIESYAGDLADMAAKACKTVEYRADATITMAEARMNLKYRVPDQQRLEWAQKIVAAMGDRLPRTQPEIYAREQIMLHERQNTEVVVQALRLGDIAIATTPCETYALTGLKLKARSPLARTMVIELANGGDGYIPPPEHHPLGGYNTWAARSAGLEVLAEPKIVETALTLMEKVAGKPRREPGHLKNKARTALLKASPVAYWPLDEMAGPRAIDLSGKGRDAYYEQGVLFFLAGAPITDSETSTNRAAHFAGGRLESRVPDLGDKSTMSFWIYNGMPVNARPMAGWCYSRGYDKGLQGDHLGVGGTTHPDRLVFQSGDGATVAGTSTIGRWTWRHVALVRDGESVRVYLDGKLEITTRAPVPPLSESCRLYLGGRTDSHSNWEGRLDEVAVFDQALNADAIKELRFPK